MQSLNAERTIQARSFFRGPNQTAPEPGELIVRVRFLAPARSGAAFHEVSDRYRDYCQVAAAAVVSDGAADLVLLRVAPTPFHVDASSALVDEGALEASSPGSSRGRRRGLGRAQAPRCARARPPRPARRDRKANA